MNFESFSGNEGVQKEVIQLQRRLDGLEGFDHNDNEAVLGEAVLMFGEDRTVADVEQIVKAYFKKIDDASNEADRRAE